MAIFKPTELDFGNQKFSVLIYGAPGVGKSTLAFSSPNAIMFDLDKGIQRVNARHRQLIAREDNYEELLSDIESEDIKNCDSIIIDTGGALITLLQDYVMRKDPVNKTKSGSISQKGFGAVKAEFVRLTNMLKTRFNKNIIYVFHSVEEKDKDGNPIQRLLCEGSAKNIVWQPIDFGCFLFKKGDKTYAGFTPTDEYFAKGCYGVNGVHEIPFGDGIKNDFLTRLFEEANKSLAADSEYFKAEKETYEAAMEAGRKLIDAIKTPEDASKVATDMKAINHCLTSLAELRQLFKDKLKDLGIVWDLITQSLLSAWLYLFNCTEDNSEEARGDFLACLRREATEQSEEMLRGISFEDAVNDYLRGDNEAPERHAAEWSKRGCEAEEAECVRRVAEIMRGGTYQLTAYKDKRITGINFVLMAKCDWVKAGIIKDCKRVTHYEPGKYLNSAQHPMYLEVLDTAYRFDYVVCDGSDVYTTDSYKRSDIPQTIDELITQFVDFLNSETGLIINPVVKYYTDAFLYYWTACKQCADSGKNAKN